MRLPLPYDARHDLLVTMRDGSKVQWRVEHVGDHSLEVSRGEVAATVTFATPSHVPPWAITTPGYIAQITVGGEYVWCVVALPVSGNLSS